MDNTQIRRVIVVCKTHLDIGFTDYAGNVLAHYCNHFIPAAMDLAQEVNTPEHKKFAWTVGSYLPWLYLRQADAQNAQRFCRAITDGHIRWHALPFTTHTELLEPQLLEWGLSLSEQLDCRFQTQTIAAKMTDVPGHTISLVPYLAKKGIRYLHIGVNTSSRLPKVPELFRWRFQGEEILVHYSGGYGTGQVLPSAVALEFMHSGDNMGPPTRQTLEDFFAAVHEKYPNAHIEAGTLEDFALEAQALRHSLPIVEQEIGDTWIHGIASAPGKVSRYRRLLKLLEEQGSSCCDACMEPLLLTAEHTWGMDTKLHLRDFTNWEKSAFAAARRADLVSAQAMAADQRVEALAALVRQDHPQPFESPASYRKFESSHSEQYNYVNQACETLSASLQQQVHALWHWQMPHRTPDAQPYIPGRILSVGQWQFRLGNDGSIEALENAAAGLSLPGNLGSFRYQCFGRDTVNNCLESYGRDMALNRYWAEFDFGKPGLFQKEDSLYAPIPVAMDTAPGQLTVYLQGDPLATREAGCPRQLVLQYDFEDTAIHLTLFTAGKDPYRAPEALWLHLNPVPSEDWQIRKLGFWLSPKNIVSGGNRQMHSVQALRLPGKLTLSGVDTPLVSMGRPNLYAVDDRIETVSGGFWFCLFNNRWGTNFPQWSDEDLRCSFCLRFLQEETS